MVRLDGEVLRPGAYNIISKKEYISDIIKRSGGFTKYAYPAGAFLIRNQKFDDAQLRLNSFMMQNAKSQLEKSSSNKIDAQLLEQAGLKQTGSVEAMDSLQQKLMGADIVSDIENTEGLVGINLTNIMRTPRGKFDLKLEEGDLIYVPRELQTVRIMGAVFFPTYVRYDKSYCLKDYINGAGGVSNTALRSKIFVLHPNGTSKSTRSFLGLRFYPRVMPGSQILVPQKQMDIRQKMTTGETISVMTSVTSMAAIIYSIVSNTLNNNSNN
jgi:protein involved in polysaccharide export with SLBB domain